MRANKHLVGPVVALSLVACTGARDEHAPQNAEAITPLQAPAKARIELSPEVLATLRAASVTHDSFARRVFYTWATEAGVAKMRSERRLLLPTEKEGQFVAEIDALAAGGDPVATVLSTHRSFAARRYAWTRAFATRVPLADRAYGDRLIEVVLRPNAVIASFDAREPVPFRFSDLDGNEVPLGRVVADPSTLAAVYHVGKNPETGDEYREFVLCNESMIAEWSVGTEAIARALEVDRTLVKTLSTAGLEDVGASPSWSHAEPSSVEDSYGATLAFDTARHRPTRENLENLAKLLELGPQGPPLVVTPTVAFAATTPHPPPVPPLPPGFGVKKRIYICD